MGIAMIAHWMVLVMIQLGKSKRTQHILYWAFNKQLFPCFSNFPPFFFVHDSSSWKKYSLFGASRHRILCVCLSYKCISAAFDLLGETGVRNCFVIFGLGGLWEHSYSNPHSSYSITGVKCDKIHKCFAQQKSVWGVWASFLFLNEHCMFLLTECL